METTTAVMVAAGAAFGAVVLGGGAVSISTFNNLGIKRNTVFGQGQTYRNLFEQRESILDRITTIVTETGKFEKGALKEIVEARRVAKDAKHLFLWLKENYPKLESVQAYRELKDEVVRIEENITTTKNDLTESIYDYNNAAIVFPANIIAGIFRFQPMNFRAVVGLESTADKDVTVAQSMAARR